jgi:hypothetical protein
VLVTLHFRSKWRNQMKTLLATVAMLAALCTPTFAGNDVDKGVAATLVYAASCDESAVPENVKKFIVFYNQTRSRQIEEEGKALYVQIYSTGFDKDTAINLWCKLMRPKITEQLNKMSKLDGF